MYTNVLKIAIPVKDDQNKKEPDCLMPGHSFFNRLTMKGNRIRAAVNHRKNAMVTGGISLATPRAAMKLPLQIKVASIAIAMPKTVLEDEAEFI